MLLNRLCRFETNAIDQVAQKVFAAIVLGLYLTAMHMKNHFEITVDEAIVSARLAAEQRLLPQTVFRKLYNKHWWHAHPLCRLHERIELRLTVLPLNYFSVL
jgi:hypothetical protein